MRFGIKTRLKNMLFIDRLVFGYNLYNYYKNEHHDLSRSEFLYRNFKRIRLLPQNHGKHQQIIEMIHAVDICPASNNCFFYSIDPYKRLKQKYQILDNCSIDYSWVVNSSFASFNKKIFDGCEHGIEMQAIIAALKIYVNKLKEDKSLSETYSGNIDEINSLFWHPAEHFHEALQRILFVNQWLWQSSHKHMGYGHLDWILYDLYQKDVDSGFITRATAKKYIIEFFNTLHDKCWYKSTMLLGDTGQIVVLGGKDNCDHYRCNDLTYLFIEASKELKLPDPKVLLRVCKTMPDDLLELAMGCIATGIGAPLLSNDDIVIPAMLQFGYDQSDTYNYATSACWEPLITGCSCDQNNIHTLDFCLPFVQFLNSDEFEKKESIDDIKAGYYKYLSTYLDELLSKLDDKQFEEDPLLTLFSPQVLHSGKDITRGGAKYNHLGVTSVGLSTVVNSLLNLDLLVFEQNEYSLSGLNEKRKNNFDGFENIRMLLDKTIQSFGNDDEKVIALTNDIMRFTSSILMKHGTKLGGRYKYGLSSPNYIVDSKNTDATFDGRKAGQPFGVHISGKNGLAPTELISFASQLDYNDNRINGNVVDFILSPGFINNNLDKTVALIKGGIRQGFYQLQINVVDSKTLIEAQKHPELFPNLVVRVWGFSAYFKDLPKEYQDNLIRRALEAESSIAVSAAS